MTRYDYIMAIDPDTEKSGVAVIRTSDKYLSCEWVVHFLECFDFRNKEKMLIKELQPKYNKHGK